jgi:trehalose-phosphatase
MSHAIAGVATDNRYKDFLESAAEAAQRVLMIDYDGTVAPFATDRSRAFPYPRVPKLLDVVAKTCSTRVIIITGGPADRIGPLLGLRPSPETWGAYGLERLTADGRHQGVEIPDETFDALSQAEQLLKENGLEKSLEISPGAVAIHWRGFTAQEILEVRTKAYRILNPLAAHSGLVVADFDGGVEIRLASASTGDAVRSVLTEIDKDAAIAYLGDDTPDEDAFRILNGRGLTALVRPKYRFTAAQVWLRPPDDLVGFLNAWIAACGGGVTCAAAD